MATAAPVGCRGRTIVLLCSINMGFDKLGDCRKSRFPIQRGLSVLSFMPDHLRFRVTAIPTASPTVRSKVLSRLHRGSMRSPHIPGILTPVAPIVLPDSRSLVPLGCFDSCRWRWLCPPCISLRRILVPLVYTRSPGTASLAQFLKLDAKTRLS